MSPEFPEEIFCRLSCLQKRTVSAAHSLEPPQLHCLEKTVQTWEPVLVEWSTIVEYIIRSPEMRAAEPEPPLFGKELEPSKARATVMTKW